MTDTPLIVIADGNESFAAFQMLKASLQKAAQFFPNHSVGWPGGSHQFTVYWLAQFRVWAVLEPCPPPGKKGSKHRFWNCFGINNPAHQKMLTITVEINPPHEGEDRRLGGLFARDTNNRTYIVHTLKVHSSQSGSGPKFRKYYLDKVASALQEVQTQGGGLRRDVAVLGPIDGPDFHKQLSGFVHSVASFKQFEKTKQHKGINA